MTTVLIYKSNLLHCNAWQIDLSFFTFAHDIHALDSKGRCWSVKQVIIVDSVEAKPFPFSQERIQTVGFISKTTATNVFGART